MKDYYFFFKDGMPLAVFLTEFMGDAMDLFGRLYRQSWSESIREGVTAIREKDVKPEVWQRVHEEYKVQAELKKRIEDSKCRVEYKAAEAKQAKENLAAPKPRHEQGSTMLETAKYLR